MKTLKEIYKAALDWICPLVPPGGKRPNGFSVGIVKDCWESAPVSFVAPFFVWFGKHYDLNRDVMDRCWYVKKISIKVTGHLAGFDVSFRRGDVRLGHLPSAHLQPTVDVRLVK